MKNLSVLGSTGSIGRNTLKIAEMFSDRFSIKALTAANNVSELALQIDKFSPEIAVVLDKERALELKNRISSGSGVKILHGEEGYQIAATYPSTDMVVTAMVGAAGLMPTLQAIDAGKEIALANKETLVMAGEIVMKAAVEKGVNILPIDSEHSAIFQCLEGHRTEDVDKIFLTASGGPFLKTPAKDFINIKPEDALNHPTWEMGKKISIDSATLMNKGLEVIEAKYFFGTSFDRIDVIIHPQSVIHSMVSYKDGSVIAQLGIPDMKGAIAYAISFPERLDLKQPIPDFASIGAFTFEQPNFEKFPCLSLAYQACKTGGTLPAVLNAANEQAVDAFLNHHISFNRIPEIINSVMESHSIVSGPELGDILEADRWAREKSAEAIH